MDIEGYVKKYIELCPGRAVSLESILLGPRPLSYRDAKFWEGFSKTPAWEFERFLEIADRGKPYQDEAWEKGDEAQRQREALDASLGYLKKILGRG